MRSRVGVLEVPLRQEAINLFPKGADSYALTFERRGIGVAQEAPLGNDYEFYPVHSNE